MSDSSFHLENIPSQTMHINRMINSDYNRSPSRTVYSDRFIPSRSGRFLRTNSPTSAEGKEDGSGTYNSLLHAALFGPVRRTRRIHRAFRIAGVFSGTKLKLNGRYTGFHLSGSTSRSPGLAIAPLKLPGRFPSHLRRFWMHLHYKMIFI